MLGKFLFDRKRFFDAYRRQFRTLSQQQVDGLERLLDSIENDPYLERIEWPAYMFATVKRETASTYHPIHEYGGRNYFVRRYGSQTRKGRELGNDTPDEGYYYAGKGDVQLTGEHNYEKAEVALRRDYPEVVEEFERRSGKKFDLTIGDQPNDLDDPRNAMYPPISYAIMSHGMRTGMFTGVRLPKTGNNYYAWRSIVNGTDHAREIADDAVKFERILRASLRDADENDILEIPPSSTARESADSTAAYQHEPAITVELPEPEAVASPAASGSGETTPIQEPAPYNGIGFWATIKRDLVAVTGGNIGFESLSTYAQQASGWPEWVVGLLTKLAVIALVVGACYLVFRVIHFGVDTWKKNKRVGYQIDADTAVDRKNIRWVPSE